MLPPAASFAFGDAADIAGYLHYGSGL